MSALENELADMIALWFGKDRESLDAEANLVTHLGLTHFDIEVLCYAIEETLDVEIDPPTIQRNPTLSQLASIIQQKQKDIQPEPYRAPTSLFGVLKPVIAERLEVDEKRIELSSRFWEDLRADELDVYELVYASEEALGIQIPDEILPQLVTVRDLLKQVAVSRASAKYRSKKSQSPVFVSYVRNDRELVMRLVRDLQRYGIEVWLDRYEIQPGEDWKLSIRKAIEKNMFFIACFSASYWKRQENLMNEELQIAIEKMRRMNDERIWFIPVKLTACNLPEFEIRSGKTLESKQWVELYRDWDDGVSRIVDVIRYPRSR